MLARVDIDLAEIDAVAGIADHVGLFPFEIQRGINAALFQPDWIRPFSGRIFRGNEEIALSGYIGSDHVECSLMVTDGRGVDAPAAVGVLEVELGLPGEAVADLLQWIRSLE